VRRRVPRHSELNMNAVDGTLHLGMARDASADAFGDTVMQWAPSGGRMGPGELFLRGQWNYVLTAFGACSPLGAPLDTAAPDWRACAALLAKYMLLVAAGGE